MTEPRRPYLAYLLRLWPARSSGKARCRASLENVQTGERRGFASLDDLFDYLRIRIGAVHGAKEVEGPQE